MLCQAAALLSDAQSAAANSTRTPNATAEADARIGTLKQLVSSARSVGVTEQARIP